MIKLCKDNFGDTYCLAGIVGGNYQDHYYIRNSNGKTLVLSVAIEGTAAYDFQERERKENYKFSYRQIRCFATSYNGYTISPDGRLYNCSHVLNEHGEIGTVEHYSPYNPNRIRFVDQTVSEQCINCTFSPICKGGCRAAELKQAKLNQCIIYKACINAVLDRLLNMEIKKEGG